MKIISWLGTVTGIMGAFMVASQIILIGYLVMACSSVAWVLFGMRAKNVALIVQSAAFLAANILGIYNYA
jgi:hypothetical protein